MRSVFDSPKVAVVLGLLALCAALAYPTRYERNRPACDSSVMLAALTVVATGIEEGGDWAVLKMRDLPEDVVSKGDTFRGCFRLVEVRQKSVVVEKVSTQERREIFLGGYSTSRVSVNRRQRERNDDFVQDAMERHKVVPESAKVDKIEYPASTNFAHLPKVIYHNTAGGSFYGDYASLGLGERASHESDSDASAHVQGVRINGPSPDSFFASLGLRDGQKIVAVNGSLVRTPEEISRLLESRDGEPVSLGYYDPETQMILSTHGVVQTR